MIGRLARWLLAGATALLVGLALGGGGAWAATHVSQLRSQRVSASVTTTAESSGSTRAAVATPTKAVTAAPPAKAAPVHPSGTLSVVVLGDSVPAGTNCDCTAYGTLVAQQLGRLQARPVSVTSLAVPGSTSTDVQTQLQSATVRRQVAAADLVLIETGANDFDPTLADEVRCVSASTCYGSQLAQTTATITQIVQTVSSLQTKATAQVSVLGYWDVFTDGQVGAEHGSTYLASSDALTRALNSAIATAATSHGATTPDVYTPFEGVDGQADPTSKLASDGDHPDAAGHALIAAAVMAALESTAQTL